MEAVVVSQSIFKSQLWKIWFHFDIKEYFCLKATLQENQA